MGTADRNDYDANNGLRIAASYSNRERAIHRADILAAKERIRLAQDRAATWANVRFCAAAVFCALALGNLIGACP